MHLLQQGREARIQVRACRHILLHRAWRKVACRGSSDLAFFEVRAGHMLGGAMLRQSPHPGQAPLHSRAGACIFFSGSLLVHNCASHGFNPDDAEVKP